jgi:PP-loop superfamily ATP-utilizing enzyme
VEVERDKLAQMMEPETRGIVERELKRIGFGSVTIDPKGFRSGSLNEGIVTPPAIGRE